MIFTDSSRKPVGWRALLVATLVTCLLLTSPAPAGAAIVRTDFPTAAQVKNSMEGAGNWRRSLGAPDAAALGARPARCRSDLPFAAATEFRNSFHTGPISGRKSYSGVVEVTVYRFASAASARRALSGLPAFLSTCAKSVEWWCENCDGIATIHRTPAAPRRVGEQSVNWNQRSVGTGIANGHAVAARTGSSVVVTVASHLSDPEDLTKPPPPPWKRALSVAKKALDRA